MKRDYLSKSAIGFLVIGLMLTSVTPIIGRHFHMPDLVRGFFTGLGIALEMIAIVKLDRAKKCVNFRQKV